MKRFVWAFMFIGLLSGSALAQTANGIKANAASYTAYPGVTCTDLLNSSIVPQVNGTRAYCSTCNQNLSCSCGGGGANALRVAGGWNCANTGGGASITGMANPATANFNLNGYDAYGGKIDSRISVLGCGLKGDGINDDGAAFNVGCRPLLGTTGSGTSTITAREVLFPEYLPSGRKAQYLITTPINATGLNSVIIEGQSTNHGIASSSPAPDLLGNTNGGAIIDRSGSNNVTLRNIYLSNAGQSTPSCIGVLDLRTCTSGAGCTGAGFAQHNIIDNAGIWMGDLGTCNSNYGSFGVFNSGAELYTISGQTQIYANRPVVLSPNNTPGVTSSFVTAATNPTSTTQINIRDADLGSAGSSYDAVFIDGGVVNLDMGDTYADGANAAVEIGAGCVGTACGSLNFFTWHGRFEGTGSNPVAPIIVDTSNNSTNPSYIAHSNININFGSDVPEVQLGSTSGDDCPYIANSWIGGENDSLTSSTSMIGLTGAGGCGATRILQYDTLSSGNYVKLSIADGGAALATRLVGSFSSISLPANSDYSLNNNSTSAVVNTSYNLTTASGTQTITGFGFTPTSCDGFGNSGTTLYQYITLFAHVDSAFAQGNMYGSGVNFEQGNGDFFIAEDTAQTDYQLGLVSAYGADFVTITWTKTGSPTGTFLESLRCIK